MGAKYLLDTNAVIDFSSHKLPDKAHKKLSAIIDFSPQISIINKIELLSLSNVPHQIVFFTQEAYVFPLNEDIVAKTIELRKKYKIKLPDAVIAATALVFNLVLITHNTIDFKNIKSLKLIDSYLMDSKPI
ncbi:type II toxin-antitoxin system VapC family toxin [Mucilaginibacter sp.]|uniref:type II toxin-antitoxin system VapC family toxin n=1 Tax=Mucilaginibacter sp. TaxID=1882438 RepID=UPI0026136E99|nr:type II toxin-antitoxin system VapC family toxin [Mucilaginibacter sp.]MDB4921142.1 PilT protein domain protein [Mucilaginibacter sp.]